MTDGVDLLGKRSIAVAVFIHGVEMRFFFGEDVMEIGLFTGRMLNQCLLADVFVDSRGEQFLFGRGLFLDLVGGVFEGVEFLGQSLVHVHCRKFIDKFNKMYSSLFPSLYYYCSVALFFLSLTLSLASTALSLAQIQQFPINYTHRITKAMFDSTFAHLDMQYQDFQIHEAQYKICSQYVKLASQKLYLDEARRISEANDLLEKLSSKQKVKDLSQWDVFTTRDSVVLEDFSTSNLSNISLDNSKNKLIIRKNALGSRTARDFDGNLNDSISEIERDCSPKTATFIKKLVEEFNKLKGKAQEAEKKEKGIKLREKMIEELQQKNTMIAKKMEDIEREIDRLRQENSKLKNENHELSETVFKKSNEINCEKKIKLYEEIAGNKHMPNKANLNGSLDILSKVLEEKENIMNLRYEQICSVEAKVEAALFSEQKKCKGCCEMVRRLKGSVLLYKHYLQREGKQMEKYVDEFKDQLGVHIQPTSL